MREEDCEAHSCATIEGLEKTKCTRKCVSQQCYNELYAWDEVLIVKCSVPDSLATCIENF